jgi:NTE family protein
MQLPKFLRSIQKKLEQKTDTPDHEYQNLAFKGGGIRGIAYMGALEKLDELGIVDGIQRVAGTSSGAIAATLLSFRLPVADTLALFNDLDLSSIPQKNNHERIEKILTIANPGSYKRLFDNYGWYSSEYFYQWISQVVAEKCKGNPRATFRYFKNIGFRDLYIVASNISRHRPEIFSFESTPDVAVADAVRLSMSIPLYFEALRFDGRQFGQGDFYVDGGLFNNYPVELFDNPRYVIDPKNFWEGLNWETLGLFLEPDEEKYANVAEHPKNLWEFVALTGRNYYDYHQVSSLRNNILDEKRTIKINDCGVSSTDFSIQPGSEIYQRLYNSGRQAVVDYFDEQDGLIP